MSEGRRGFSFKWIVAAAGLAAATGAVACFTFVFNGTRQPNRAPNATFDKNSPVEVLSAAVRNGDVSALSELADRVLVNPGGDPPKAFDSKEGKVWIDTLAELRAGFPKFAPGAQATILNIVGAIFDRAAIEPAPPTWSDALPPSHDLFVSGMIQRDPVVRIAALSAVGKFWTWLPGRSLMPIEEDTLAAWKQGFYEPAKRALSDNVPEARAAAVACIAAISLDDAAEPAVHYVSSDPSAQVRKQALLAFARRPTLLSEEMILPRLHDADPAVALIAEKVLQGRGLTKDQITLGKEVFHPHPDHRVRAVAQLTAREDIDPLVWLLYLSYDPDERVRREAAGVLAKSDSLEARDRVREMARFDDSKIVKETLHKLAPGIESQGLLPPLPGASALNPRAN